MALTVCDVAQEPHGLFVPRELHVLENHQTDLPRIARDPALTSQIEESIQHIPTRHLLYRADSRALLSVKPGSVHLVVCSPPYWTLKKYNPGEGQLGYVEDYEEFLTELDRVWELCLRALIPGGRLVIVVGDVCLSRRKNKGRHVVVPLHASIQEP